MVCKVNHGGPEGLHLGPVTGTMGRILKPESFHALLGLSTLNHCVNARSGSGQPTRHAG